MSRRLLAAFALALTPSLLPAAEPPKDFLVQPGDRVLFLGDSITEQFQYSSDIELYLTTRFPKANLTFLNAGISGDTAGGGAGRFQQHVLAEKPTVVTIDFGMNDGGYGTFNPGPAKTYAGKTEAMLEAAKKAGVKVALISPNAVDRRVKPKDNPDKFKVYVETQKQFYAPLKELADKHRVPFVDQYAVTRAALERMEADPNGKAANPFPDAVHTNGQGGLLMAHTILVGLKAPALVSNAVIDAAAGTTDAGGCTVADVTPAAGGVSFTRTDEALPLPVQKDWLPILPYVNHLNDLNVYGLAVKGLKDGAYAVLIDGKQVGQYSAKELAGGVNLGITTAGPIWEQGNAVLQAINAKNDVVHNRFRGVVMFNPPDWLADAAKERKPAELARRAEQIAALQAKVYELAAPKPHKFEVLPAK